MRNFLKRMGEYKLQITFFAGLLGLVVLSIVLASVTKPKETVNNPDPKENISQNNDEQDNKDTVVVTAPEFVCLPLDASSDYIIVRTFYDKEDTKENQIKSLIKFENSFRTSLGTSYALKSGESFDVLASISGQVIEASTSPLFGNYIVISSDNDIKTYYYGLSEQSVTKGALVKQGDVIGKSGTTTVDNETGIHVYFQITKNGKYLNPEKTIGAKVTDVK